MTSQPWMWATLGGALIGLSSALLLLSHGRIAGVSGIIGGLLARPRSVGAGWRWAFVAGLVVSGGIASVLLPQAHSAGVVRSPWAVALAGLLVGFGTRLGSGCTSGHGVCGVGRLSRRSIVATGSFIAAGALTVAVVNVLFGGVL